MTVALSRWRPDGGYDYFEAQNQMQPLGDDLPDPVMPSETSFGVPSIEVGHPMRSGARHVGEGPLARGMMLPMDTSNLGDAGSVYGLPPWGWGLVGAGIVGIAWWLHERS